jgi:hypothetical protein
VTAMNRPEPLHIRIGKLRDEARAEAVTAGSPAREQLDVVDGSIRVVAGLAGKSDVERRATLRDVRPGMTVTAQGAAKTVRSRTEQLDTALGWAKTLSPEQRERFIVSERFDALSDWQQEILSKAFGQAEAESYEESTGVESFNLDAPTPDVDAIVGYEDDDESDGELDALGESNFDELFNQTPWEGDVV